MVLGDGAQLTVSYRSVAPFGTASLKKTFWRPGTWRRNPVPACNCDSGFTCGGDGGDEAQPYEPQPNPGGQCSTGLQFAAPIPQLFGFYVSNAAPHDTPLSIVSLMDEVAVPPGLEGEYLLSFRWDCEQTPQVWNSCADITIQRM